MTKKYVIQDREAGNVIEECNTRDEAEFVVSLYETEDRSDGTFTEDFYEIKEVDCADYFNDVFDLTKEMRGYGHWMITLYYHISGEKFCKIITNTEFIDNWKEDDGVTRNEENAAALRDYILSANGIEK